MNNHVALTLAATLEFDTYRRVAAICRLVPEVGAVLSGAAAEVVTDDARRWEVYSQVKARITRPVGWEAAGSPVRDADDFFACMKALDALLPTPAGYGGRDDDR